MARSASAVRKPLPHWSCFATMDESRAVEERWDQQREAGARFGFGRNWTRFQRTLSPEQIASARESMAAMLEQTSLAELRFLDAGCGSGLFSLCARQLGADVVSFDFDPESVACTQRVQQQHALDDPHWRVLQGSILNPAFVASLGQFDVVYAWGVLHHTGRMNDALANAVLAVKPGGRLFISVYNDQGSISRYWWQVKRAYNRYPLLKPFIIAAHAPHLFGARVAG